MILMNAVFNLFSPDSCTSKLIPIASFRHEHITLNQFILLFIFWEGFDTLYDIKIKISTLHICHS